jgi:hypothetical protein
MMINRLGNTKDFNDGPEKETFFSAVVLLMADFVKHGRGETQ